MFFREMYPMTDEWKKTFAWWPRRLTNGKLVWLVPVEVSSYHNIHVNYDVPYDKADRVFRLPASNTREYLHG